MVGCGKILRHLLNVHTLFVGVWSFQLKFDVLSCLEQVG